jgi:hypothetical protein
VLIVNLQTVPETSDFYNSAAICMYVGRLRIYPTKTVAGLLRSMFHRRLRFPHPRKLAIMTHVTYKKGKFRQIAFLLQQNFATDYFPLSYITLLYMKSSSSWSVFVFLYSSPSIPLFLLLLCFVFLLFRRSLHESAEV